MSKVNTDAALNKGERIAGIGAIIRNNQGHVIACFAKKLHGVLNPELVEAYSYYALKGAVSDIHGAFESECVQVVEAVNE